MTAGIVSARARDILGPYNDFIQIDAPVNQGNSGGPAFDVSGNVIGIGGAICSPTGGLVGIGFAIPAETVKTIADRLKDKGRVSRGWIGMEVQSVKQTDIWRPGRRTSSGKKRSTHRPCGRF